MTDIGLGLAGAELPEEGGDDEHWWTVGVLAAIAGLVGFSCYSSYRKGRHYKCAWLELLPCTRGSGHRACLLLHSRC